MDDKRIEFPCTKKCLVYASCQTVCFEYRDYVEESYRMHKYRCFKIIPPPPKQIQQLSELMNRVEDPWLLISYYPEADILVITDKSKGYPKSVMSNIRKRKNLHSYSNFPQELK